MLVRIVPTSSFVIAPRFFGSIGATTILTRGDVGVGIGVQLPEDAKAQIDAGEPWDVTNGAGSTPGSWGGHYMYVCGYTTTGPVCVTWGRKQQATWGWLAKYCDEAYAIFDAKNKFKANIVDPDKLRRALDAV